MSHKSTSSIVREILSRYPTLYRSMQMGVLNYSAAARYIQAEVESMLRREVELNTIVANFVRMAKALDEPRAVSVSDLFRNARLSVATGMTQIEVPTTPKQQTRILALLSELDFEYPEHLSIHQFPTCIRILCSSRDADSFATKMKRKIKFLRKDGFATLNLRIHNPLVEETTIIAYIIDLLNRNDVAIYATYSVQSDMLFVLSERDTGRAIDLIRSIS